jgi:hypothetical protein
MQHDITGWLRTLTDDPPEGYESGLRYFLGGAYNGLSFSLTSRYPLGTNVFQREWDLLLVLDACRVDALKAVAPEYDWIDSVDSMWSVGSSSHEWLCKTFTGKYADEIAETGYISSNPHTRPTFIDGARPPQKYITPVTWADWDVVDEDQIGLLRYLPHDHEYSEYFDTLPPDIVTDHTIEAGRTGNFERIIAHYFQPHRPHIAGPYREARRLSDTEDRPWRAIQTGAASKAEVWQNYLNNLRLVLKSIERLRENIDARRVVITADHGELFGELGQYGHPEGFVHPKLKKVPWATTTATDSGTSTPAVKHDDPSPSNSEVTERLEQLGYL